jgi:predicted metal-dependent enzyme (double-stranded beta helix superfamily)
MSKRTKLWYKPIGLALGALAGAAAGYAFKQVWQLVAGDQDAPDATDEERGWGEVLAAAALQGAIFAVVKAAVDRGGATGVRQLTGRWPS